ADAGQLEKHGQVDVGDFVQLAHGLELLQVEFEGGGVDVIGGLSAVTPHFQNVGDRAAAQTLPEDRFQLGLEAGDVVGQLDGGFEVAVIEGADFDGIMGAV